MAPRKQAVTHWFSWKRGGLMRDNPRRAALYGQRCRILARGKMNSVMVAWESGGWDIVDWQALRRIK